MKYALRLCISVVLLGVLSGCAGSTQDLLPTTSGTTVQTSAVVPAASTSVPATADTTTASESGPITLGPVTIDVPVSEVSRTLISPGGGTIEAGYVTLAVPQGAVAADTQIVICQLETPFRQDPSSSADPQAVSAVPISSVYDFGPPGTIFNVPVTITLRYDAGFGPDGAEPDRIAVAYWDGQQWKLGGGIVDPVSRTVSVEVERFDGGIITVILASTAAGIVANRIITWSNPEGVKQDPVSTGEAKDWITPDDPKVKEQAAKAVIMIQGTDETKPLDSPDLAEWVKSAVERGQIPQLAYEDSSGIVAGGYDDGKGSNWQKPADYFTKGTVENGAYFGDCTDATNATVSVFRAKGFRAKGVLGYGGGSKDRPHAWGEVLIGDQVYRIDEQGGLITPKNFQWHFDTYKPIIDPSDPRYQSMWDEKGQQSYDPDWWKIAGFAGTYKASWAGFGVADSFEFTVLEDGTVEGTLSFSGPTKVGDKSVAVTYEGSYTGMVSKDGQLTATGTLDFTMNGKSRPEWTGQAMSLTGQIAGDKFTGGWSLAGSGVGEVVGARQ